MNDWHHLYIMTEMDMLSGVAWVCAVMKAKKVNFNYTHFAAYKGLHFVFNIVSY